MTNYKQLCVELLDSAEELDDLIEGIRLGNYMPDSFTLQPMRAVSARARNALAEPEPEGPTDEEIMELMPQQMRDDLAAAARVMSSLHPDIDKTDSVFRMILNRHSVDHARAVLARWGK